MKKEKKFKMIMVTITFVIIAILLGYIQTFYNQIGDAYTIEEKLVLENGYIDVTKYNFKDATPVKLNGDWIIYRGVYFNEDMVDYALIDPRSDANLISLPIRDLTNASNKATYKASIKLDLTDENLEKFVISIPFMPEDVNVFINGKKIEGYIAVNAWYGFDFETMMYSFKDVYDYESQNQEIIISVNPLDESFNLYNREISLSYESNIVAVQKIDYVLQGILLGMMIMSMFIGVLYIVMLPTYSRLTFLNLFDIALMSHIFLSLTKFPYILIGNEVDSSFRDLIIKRLDLFSLFLAFFIGNILTGLLFDPDKKHESTFGKPINIGFLSFAILFLVIPEEHTIIMNFGSLIILCISAVGNIVRFKDMFGKNKFDKYMSLHFVKSIFLMIITGIDYTSIYSSTRPQGTILLGYMIFLIMHLIARVAEHRLAQIGIAKLNEDLETSIEIRTKELTEANEVLKNLSIMDALTKANNRLYFEEKIFNLIDEINNRKSKVTQLHMCIFDLDNFKSINDTFGHAVGDEQLIETVQIMKSVVKDDVTVCRIGGEEFTMLFLDYSDSDVLKTVEQTREALEVLAQKEGRTTGSFGVAKHFIDDNMKDLFTRADECLYNVKENGKNHIVYNFYGSAQTFSFDTMIGF